MSYTGARAMSPLGACIRSPLGALEMDDSGNQPAIAEYVKLWDLTFKSRYAEIYADDSWQYVSMCHSCPYSISHGLGLKYKIGGLFGDGWYYDDSSPNPFNQSILGYQNDIFYYFSSGLSAPPSDLNTYCYRHPGTDPIQFGGMIKPTVLYYKVPPVGDLARGWTTQMAGVSLRKPKNILERIGPTGFYDYIRFSGFGFDDDVYPVSTLHWDYTDEDGIRYFGSLGFNFIPYVVSAYVAVALDTLEFDHEAIGVIA